MRLLKDKLDKVLKRKWLAALRSGQFRQGRGCLKTAYTFAGAKDGEMAFCCLGVLNEISDKVLRSSDGAELLSPASCGITRATQKKLANLNDGIDVKPQTFSQIADYIEANL